MCVTRMIRKKGTEIDLQPYYRRIDRRTERDKQVSVMGIVRNSIPRVQQQILETFHEGNPGIARMRSLGRSYVQWPKMDRQIEERVQ